MSDKNRSILLRTDKSNDERGTCRRANATHKTSDGEIYSFAYFTLVYQLTLAFAYVFMQIFRGGLSRTAGVSRFVRLCVL